eukprot:gnl/TRDRNA2_/TRDRNA2_59650_c0_seq1.p1 gnl/TRDRNA2_/TRDRNA2_59650_c0~~gnl/TRDRNA2_/TRDRNA2_59650_c0_seq1.p1  ORF type:complete len:228 (-),score=36.70 gnl/TRDRNA2_/TRDRNA2_59650_c0_seq1:55-738(-)
MADAAGMVACLISPLNAALCLIILLRRFGRALMVMRLRSDKAEKKRAIIQQKLKRGGGAQNGDFADVAYYFNAFRVDGSRCRVSAVAKNIDSAKSKKLSEGGSANVYYLPDELETCLLELELEEGMFGSGSDDICIWGFFLAFTGLCAVVGAVFAFSVHTVYGILAISLDALVLIVCSANRHRMKSSDIVSERPVETQVAVIGMPFYMDSDGAATATTCIANADMGL